MSSAYTYAIEDGTNLDPIAYLVRYAQGYTTFSWRDKDRPVETLPELPAELPLDAYEYKKLAEREQALATTLAMTEEDKFHGFAEALALWEASVIAARNALVLKTWRLQNVLQKLEALDPQGNDDMVSFKQEAMEVLRKEIAYINSGYIASDAYSETSPDGWWRNQIEYDTRSVNFALEDLRTAQERVRNHYRWGTALRDMISRLGTMLQPTNEEATV